MTLADKNCKISTKGEVRVNLSLGKNDEYKSTPFTIMENCVTDVIIGLKTLELHESVIINF